MGGRENLVVSSTVLRILFFVVFCGMVTEVTLLPVSLFFVVTAAL